MLDNYLCQAAQVNQLLLRPPDHAVLVQGHKKHLLYYVVQVLSLLHILVTDGRYCIFWQKLLLCLNHHQLSGLLLLQLGLRLPVSDGHLQGGKEGGKGVPLQVGGDGAPLQTLLHPWTLTHSLQTLPASKTWTRISIHKGGRTHKMITITQVKCSWG